MYNTEVILPLFCFCFPNSNTVVTSMTTRSISKNPTEIQTAVIKTFVWLCPVWDVDWLGEGMTTRNEVALETVLDSSVGRFSNIYIYIYIYYNFHERHNSVFYDPWMKSKILILILIFYLLTLNLPTTK